MERMAAEPSPTAPATRFVEEAHTGVDQPNRCPIEERQLTLELRRLPRIVRVEKGHEAATLA